MAQTEPLTLLQKPVEVIEALGGTFALARRLSRSPQIVSGWKTSRIPCKYYLLIQEMLADPEIGKTAAPSVFGMLPPREQLRSSRRAVQKRAA